MSLTAGAIILLGLLQLPQSKNAISSQLTALFNDRYEGTLKMDGIGGMLPFSANLYGIGIYPPGNTENPVISVDTATIEISLWDLIRQNITVRSLELDQPLVHLARDKNDELTLGRAFRKKDRPEDPPPERTGFNRFRIYAPNILVHNGEMTAENLPDNMELPGLPSSFTLKNIDADFYLELASGQKFLDIDHLSADIGHGTFKDFHARGQIFSDREYLEFNGFRIRSADSQIEFTGEATPVYLFGDDPAGDLADATFRLDIKNSRLHGKSISAFLPDYPFGDTTLDIELIAAGTLESLYIDRLTARADDSSIQLTGLLENIGTPRFRYQTSIGNAVFQPPELSQLSDRYLPYDFSEDALGYLSGIRVDGRLDGDRTRIETDLSLDTRRGRLTFDAALAFGPELKMDAHLKLDSLDLSPIFARHLQRSLLDGSIDLSGSGNSISELQGTLQAELESGYVNRIAFNRASLTGSLQDGTLQHTVRVEDAGSEFGHSGWIRNRDNEWALSVRGRLQEINVTHLLQRDDLPETSINMKYDTDLEWTNPDDLYGRVNFEVGESVAGPDTLRPHQLYADLNAPAEPGGERILRLTSSFLDAELSGDIYPRNLVRLYRHWKEYITRQVAEEIVMDSTFASGTEGRTENDILPADLSLTMELKDLALVRNYLAAETPFGSQSRVSMNLNAGPDRILVTGSVNDSDLHYGQFSSGRLSANLTASFRYAEKLRNHGTMDLQIDAANYSYRDIDFSEGYLNASWRSDSLMVTHSSAGNGNGVQLDLTLLSRLNPGNIHMQIRDFHLGDGVYEWTAEEQPELRYFSDRSLRLDNVSLTSNDEQVEISGTFSGSPVDAVEYKIRNLQLQRISDLIGGRVSFAGTVNGDFITRTLNRSPVFEGDLSVVRAMLNDRLVGDLSLSSTFSSARNRFDTSISVITDPDKYPGYYSENDSTGQNLVLNGYFSAPDFNSPDRDFYHFDADFREIDMWIATVIVPGILNEAEGSSSGSGYIRGSLTDYDFNAVFDIDDVVAVPSFLNTTYTVNGKLIFNRHNGLIFDSLDLQDSRNGTGILSGSVDLDNFSDTNYLDLTLDMNNFHFMNNPYDPDVPYYAEVRGTGQARVTGSNFNPFLRTTRPVVISPGSRISVPVLDDTELQQNQNFIQFVDSFDGSYLREREQNSGDSQESTFQYDQAALTFAERFTLDLQFIAEDPVNFQLIFDRVTNEVLTANGTGQIRLNLEDQNFSLFGRMNISGGDYQFVAGDIISRRFQLMEGGSIIWEGNPANARLNVNANYRARPDMSSLLTSGVPDRLEGAQRFPIDLILNIGGTLSELENDFYFQIPSSIEGTLGPTLLTQVNALNRNEDEKIIQATSILLSGNFIPLASASTEGGTGLALRESLSGGAVVNPLITSQVINPLLSDQINSLLRSDMALDIDFNLTTYNQVDLGVAFRLYDDRLILRRDGQITGPYSDIGDLGATYRINQTFAVTAFHRQDPTLANSSTAESRQVQEMNGVGLEAQMQFNTWREFRQRFTNAFNWLFGRKDDDNNNRDEAEAGSGSALSD